MGMAWAGRLSALDTTLDSDLRDLAILRMGGHAFLTAMTGQGGGISVYEVHSGSLARLVDTAHVAAPGLGLGALAQVALDGATQLVVTGTGDGRLLRYRIGEDGQLPNAGTIDLPGKGAETCTALASVKIKGATLLCAVDGDTGRLGGWVTDGTGRLTKTAPTKGPAHTFAPEGATELATVRVEGQRLLLAADSGGNGVTSYTIGAATGRIAFADSLGAGDGLGVSVPTALETVTAFGATWVLLAAAGSSSLSVMRLSNTGALTATDHVIDTLATRFGGVTALATARVDGHVLVLAGGADDGISLFTLLPDGRLVHLETLAHDTGLGLENITALAATRMGESLQIFAASGTEGGIAQLSLDLSDLGAVIRAAAGTGAGTVAGTQGNDVMLARGGTGTLRGQAGDDVLVAGPEGGTLAGGAGADTFVLGPATGPIRIADFEPGTDRIDLSAFPLLHDPAQLEATPLAHGIRLSFGATAIRVISAEGTPLSLADLWPRGFAGPDRVPLPKGPLQTLTLGTAQDESFRTGAADDTVRARGGDDRVQSLRGDDRLYGGAGNDRLAAGPGADLLAGQGGRDTLLGGAGRDRLAGGKGNDVLIGQKGNDVLTGGGGADEFRFGKGHGTDRILDFDPARDHIRLLIKGADYRGLDIHADGADTLVDTGAGLIRLVDTSPADLGPDVFLF